MKSAKDPWSCRDEQAASVAMIPSESTNDASGSSVRQGPSAAQAAEHVQQGIARDSDRGRKTSGALFTKLHHGTSKRTWLIHHGNHFSKNSVESIWRRPTLLDAPGETEKSRLPWTDETPRVRTEEEFTSERIRTPTAKKVLGPCVTQAVRHQIQRQAPPRVLSFIVCVVSSPRQHIKS